MHSEAQAAAALQPMVACRQLVKIYRGEGVEVVALSGLDLTVERGELMAVVGASGSGKSTLLNLLGGLDSPTAGKLAVDGQDMLALTPKRRAAYRRSTVGFLWQNPARNLVNYLSLMDNVLMTMRAGGAVDRAWARELLERVGMLSHAEKRPQQLSGGQQQRVAMAVALANRPKLLLADEPTGAVDTDTAEGLLALLRTLRDELGLTVLIVTHDARMMHAVERTVSIRDGRVAAESLRTGDRELSLTEALGHRRRDYLLMDPSGRVNLPPDALETAGLSGCARLVARAEPGRLVLTGEEGGEGMDQGGEV